MSMDSRDIRSSARPFLIKMTEEEALNKFFWAHGVEVLSSDDKAEALLRRFCFYGLAVLTVGHRLTA